VVVVMMVVVVVVVVVVLTEATSAAYSNCSLKYKVQFFTFLKTKDKERRRILWGHIKAVGSELISRKKNGFNFPILGLVSSDVTRTNS
jgi:hypothetical protein